MEENVQMPNEIIMNMPMSRRYACIVPLKIAVQLNIYCVFLLLLLIASHVEFH